MALGPGDGEDARPREHDDDRLASRCHSLKELLLDTGEFKSRPVLALTARDIEPAAVSTKGKHCCICLFRCCNSLCDS